VSIPVATQPLPLEADRQKLMDAVMAHLDPDRLRDLLVRLVDIHSPTGAERAASEFMAGHLRNEVGIDARYQPVTDDTGNAYGEMTGTGDGARLLLYAPIDTHIEPEVDHSTVGRRLREDMLPTARVDGDLVLGLGASNPKCMVAGLTEVVHAVKDSGIPLVGDLAIGFAGGGMPWSNSRRGNVGMSSGVVHLLTHGLWPDYCAVLKPRYAVFAEEPGMCWFKVSVYGDLGYAGIARGTPGFRSSIVPAATVIQEIEEWLPEYTRRNTSGGILPEGWIAAVRAGDPDKPAFPSGTTEIYLDMRITSRTTPANVRSQFGELIDAIRRRHPDVEIDWEMYGSVPGGSTPYDNWIIQSAQRGWEYEEKQSYDETPYQAGQTDGAIIRALGVPAARIGYPWPPASIPADLAAGLGGMGVASVDDVMKGVRIAAYTVVDTLTRTRAELGL
jgi:acetylornithine deacetylase/succinyl-diaminopimelate desuccinylase-like protein